MCFFVFAESKVQVTLGAHWGLFFKTAFRNYLHVLSFEKRLFPKGRKQSNWLICILLVLQCASYCLGLF